MSSGGSNSTIIVENLTRKRIVADQIQSAENSLARRRGLLDVRDLDASSGLWINPCEAIHTFGMKVNLDVVFLDASLQVRKIVPDLRPNRIAFCLTARSVLEIRAGTAELSGLECGDQLAIHKSGSPTAEGYFIR